LLITNQFLRSGRVDTWAGPDASVQSGLVLASCPVVEARGDESFPAWIRFRGATYASSGRVSPVGLAWKYGMTPFTETDYRLGGIRLLLPKASSGAEPPESVLLLQEQARATRRYDRTDCV
jgi:hypothetical protein